MGWGLLNKLFCEKRVQYSPQKISDALDILAHNIGKIELSAQIISPMFKDTINGKKFYINSETIPLVFILQDAIRFIYGRLGRFYFDGQGVNNTASIRVLIDQIFNDKKVGEDRKLVFRAQFETIRMRFNGVRAYKKRLNTFSNKHYAHADIKPLNALVVEEVKISIPWHELVNLITEAKMILRDMFVVCHKPPFDYSEHIYQEYADQFWRLINFTEQKVIPH